MIILLILFIAELAAGIGGYVLRNKVSYTGHRALISPLLSMLPQSCCKIFMLSALCSIIISMTQRAMGSTIWGDERLKFSDNFLLPYFKMAIAAVLPLSCH